MQRSFNGGQSQKKFVPYVAVHIFVPWHSKIAIARTLRIMSTTVYSEDNLTHLIYVCMRCRYLVLMFYDHYPTMPGVESDSDVGLGTLTKGLICVGQ